MACLRTSSSRNRSVDACNVDVMYDLGYHLLCYVLLVAFVSGISSLMLLLEYSLTNMRTVMWCIYLAWENCS